MKDEKKVKATEEAKKEVQTEENGAKLTDEQLAKVNAAGDEDELEIICRKPSNYDKPQWVPAGLG